MSKYRIVGNHLSGLISILSLYLHILQLYRVSVEVKRVGGAYGGKITRNNILASVCGLAAYLTNRYYHHNIRIYYECEIDKSTQRITVWHHEACQVMTNGDPEGWIFYPTLSRIAESFSCSTLFFI